MSAKKNSKNPINYTVERDVQKRGNLRYDITKIPSSCGIEFNRTRGHSHMKGEKETFHILHGEALFFLKKGEEIIIIIGKKGQKVVVPPFYFHSIANIGRGTLTVGNWIHKDCERVYYMAPWFKIMQPKP